MRNIVAKMDVTSHRGKRMKGWVSKEEKWRVEREVEAAAGRRRE